MTYLTWFSPSYLEILSESLSELSAYHLIPKRTRASTANMQTINNKEIMVSSFGEPST